jgi:hypothetical protein
MAGTNNPIYKTLTAMAGQILYGVVYDDGHWVKQMGITKRWRH